MAKLEAAKVNNETKVTSATAVARGVRISPRKTRLVVDLVRGKTVAEAVQQLQNLNKGAAKPVLKVVLSALANAENNHHLKKEALVISKITVDEGQALKRYRAAGKGSGRMILRPSSHITVVVEEKAGAVKKSTRFAFPVILKREKKVKVEHTRDHKHEHDEEVAVEGAEVAEPVKEKKTSKAKADKGQAKKTSTVKRIFNRRGGEK